MDFKEPETTQIRIDGMKLKQFIDTELYGLLSKEFEDLKVVNITFISKIDEQKKELISMGYPYLELEENDQLIIDANGRIYTKVIKVLNDFKED